jgi:hypothetical protein
MDFRDTPALISAGYRLTSEWLSQHAAVVAA